MELAAYDINYSQAGEHITIWPLGDIHYGTKHCDIDRFKASIASIKDDPNAYWIGMGDYCECITISDPRFAAEEIDPELYPMLGTLAVSQRDRMIEMLMPIKDRCIGLIEGNHERVIKTKHYVDITRDMARELGVKYLDTNALIRLVCRRDLHTSTFIIYAEHGHGSGSSASSHVTGLEKMMANFRADIYLRGHVHAKMAHRKPALGLSSKGRLAMTEHTRLGVLTGSYYRGYQAGTSSYVSRAGYPPVELGTPQIIIYPETKELDVII